MVCCYGAYHVVPSCEDHYNGAILGHLTEQLSEKRKSVDFLMINFQNIEIFPNYEHT